MTRRDDTCSMDMSDLMIIGEFKNFIFKNLTRPSLSLIGAGRSDHAPPSLMLGPLTDGPSLTWTEE